MTDFFRTVLNMSITGAYISAVIIILRLMMKNLPKKYSYMLWIILGIRLVCPFSFSSAVSIFNVLMPDKPAIETGQMEYIPSDIGYAENPTVTISVPAVNDAVNDYLPPAQPYNSVNPMQIIMLIASLIWVVGMAVMVVWSVVSWLSVKKRVRGAEEKDGYSISPNIETPFVFGIKKPRIYLPDGISDEDKHYILAHENTHIRRGDHIVKIIAMAALCIHWFNPLVWISYRLMTKDMELSCDEKALDSFEENVKKAYANALLNISVKQNKLTLGGVLSFGESDIKSRIKGVLAAKKPKSIVTIIAVIALITAAVCLLTNAKAEKNYPPVNDGVYVTEKLLYNSPFRDLYPGDYNGNIYEINDGIMKVSGRYYLDGYAEFSVSEPMEIPFTDKEWSEKYGIVDGIGWQDGEVSLSDYKNKYCYATKFIPSDESDIFYTDNAETESYLFVMDRELWLVDRMEIFRLKEVIEDTPEDITDDGVKDETASAPVITEQTAMIKQIRQLPVSVPTENGFAVDASYPAVTIEQYVQLGWLADGSGEDGIFTVDGTVVMENTVIYPDSYELSKEEITELTDDAQNYVSITHSGGYYAVYVFPRNEYFSESTADMIVKSTVIRAPSADIAAGDLPNGYKQIGLSVPYGKLTEHGVEFDSSMEISDVNAFLTIPQEWDFSGSSVAECDEKKLMEIGAAWSAADGYILPETEDGRYINDLGREVTVLDEEYSPDGTFEYRCHRSVPDFYSETGVYEYQYYILRRGDVYISLSFVVNEYYDGNIFENVIRSLSIEPVYNAENMPDMTEQGFASDHGMTAHEQEETSAESISPVPMIS